MLITKSFDSDGEFITLNRSCLDDRRCVSDGAKIWGFNDSIFSFIEDTVKIDGSSRILLDSVMVFSSWAS